MDLEEYRRLHADREGAAPGWEAMNVPLGELYGKQDPQHWGTIIRYTLGGPDPIDGISAYECRSGSPATLGLRTADHLHFCTFGYTSLYYDEESVGGDESGYGFEMTFRLACPLPSVEPPIWVCSLFQNLARYVFETGNVFRDGHWIPANGPIRRDSDTQIVGLAFLEDPALPPIRSPHGVVRFIQAFGITQSEVDSLLAKTRRAREIIDFHRQTNPMLVTDLARTGG